MLRVFVSIHAKLSVNFSIKPTFSILHNYFSKTLTSDYLFYIIFYLNNHSSLLSSERERERERERGI